MVENVTTPVAEGLAVPNIVSPIVKVTGFALPVGSPPLLVSVAVNLTGLPAVDGFGVDVSVIVICAGLTI